MKIIVRRVIIIKFGEREALAGVRTLLMNIKETLWIAQKPQNK